MRQFVTIIILTSMFLHCMSRLGMVEYIFKQRHSIAHTLGIIDEIPMAMCDSDYVGDLGFVYTEVDQDQQVPSLPLQLTSEIQLFLFPPSIGLSKLDGSVVSHQTLYSDYDMRVFTSSVFHPPARVFVII
jgi:hypothetical protein